MNNLSIYIPQTRDWITQEAEEVGWDYLCKYYNRVYHKLITMKDGERFSIIKNVQPENFELFIKCTCACINELSSQGVWGWSLERNATVIERVKIHTKKNTDR